MHLNCKTFPTLPVRSCIIESIWFAPHPESIRTAIRIEYKVSVHDRKLRCQWGVPVEHSIRFDIHYRRRLVRANTQTRRKQKRKRERFLSKHFFVLPFSKYENYLPSPIIRPLPLPSLPKRFTFTEISVHVRLLFVECVIWIFIRAHARQMIQNLIKKLFTSNHLNRKSSETFVIEHIYDSESIFVRIRSSLYRRNEWRLISWIGIWLRKFFFFLNLWSKLVKKKISFF